MHVTVPDGVSTCRSKNAKGECVEKVFGCVIAKDKIRTSRPHKAVSF